VDDVEDAFVNVEEAGLRGGILGSLVSVGLLDSALGTAGFLAALATVGLGGIGFLSRVLVPGLEVVLDDAEDVDEADLVDLASSPAVGLVLPVDDAAVGLADDVVVLAEVVVLLADPAVLVVVGFVVVVDSFLAGVALVAGVAGLLTTLPGVGLDVAVVLEAGVVVFLGEAVVAAEVFFSSFLVSFSSDFLGLGAGDLSLTGVAGVSSMLGMLRLATPAVTPATDSSFTLFSSGSNSTSSSPPS